MRFIVGPASLVLLVVILLDVFETVLLPRRVTHGYRFARFFYRHTWAAWCRAVQVISSPRRRESMLSVFGPLALLLLFCVWAGGLVVAFGLLHWALQTPMTRGEPLSHVATYLYFSGTTFFTLGYGDLTPAGGVGRLLAVVESGLGFGFLAIVIGYLPVLAQAFSKREIAISKLDARGGSPPTAAQILIRSRRSQNGAAATDSDLAIWETWAAELLESCLSFPVLAYYRSQHDNQSWLAALTAILDTCALVICGTERASQYQARLTFAIARHAAVDLTLVFKITPVSPQPDRLEAGSLAQLKEVLGAAGIPLVAAPDAEWKLAELRRMYEPMVNGLAQYFRLRLPGFVIAQPTADNWQTSAWMPPTPGILDLESATPGDHFE
jgi:hypothetical protein